MEENKILVKNLKINYKTFGGGNPPSPEAFARQRPFLILHGWGSKSERWEKVANLLAEKNLFVVVPDLPGFGKSQEPETAWNLDNYVEFVKEFTEKVPELNNNFYLLGHSFGGAISAKFSIMHAQQVEKLFLAAAACHREKTVTKNSLSRASKMVKVFSFVPGYVLFRKAVYKYILRKSDYAYVSGVIKETYLKVIAEDLSQKLLFIKVPTVILWGDSDDLTPVEDAYYMNKKIDGSKLFVFEGVGHNLDRHEHPKLMGEKIIACLS